MTGDTHGNFYVKRIFPAIQKKLGNLAAILKKAEEQGPAKKIDGKVFLDARLFPNMFFYFQSPRLTTSCA